MPTLEEMFSEKAPKKERVKLNWDKQSFLKEYDDIKKSNILFFSSFKIETVKKFQLYRKCSDTTKLIKLFAEKEVIDALEKESEDFKSRIINFLKLANF